MPTDRQQTEGQDGGAYGSAAVAEGWRRGAAARAQALGPLTEMMLDLADIGPGSRVLDVGAGTGEQTLMAAYRVGPTGSVLATDLAASMLAVAAEAARQAGLSSVEVRVADARDLDLEPESFDAAISRLALELIPGRERALAGIYRALKPGGKLAAIVPSSAEKTPSKHYRAPLCAAMRGCHHPTRTPGSSRSAIRGPSRPPTSEPVSGGSTSALCRRCDGTRRWQRPCNTAWTRAMSFANSWPT